MSNTKYKPAHNVTRTKRITCMSHDAEGVCHFEVRGADYSSGIEFFEMAYIAQRKQLFKDMGWGKWTKAGDLGFQNYLLVKENNPYSLGYYENKFTYRVSAQIKCCGKWLGLGKFTNTCTRCGADYNGSGQLLASRSLWGEETGEHWTECY